MYIESIIIVFVVALVRRYNFVHIEDFPRKNIAFPVLFAIFNLLYITAYKHGDMSLSLIRVCNTLNFFLLYPYLLSNLRYSGMLMTTAGVALNHLAMAVNGGAMPASAAMSARVMDPEVYSSLFSGLVPFHKLIDHTTRLPFLGDVLMIARPYPFPKVISIGDVLLMVGFVVLATSVLRGDYSRGSDEEDEEEDLKIFPRFPWSKLRDDAFRKADMEDTHPRGPRFRK